MKLNRNLTKAFFDQNKKSLETLLGGCTLLVFLRHIGCTFCRETVRDLSQRKKEFSRAGVELVFVTMSDEEKAKPFFNNYQMENYSRISDTRQVLYEAFSLHLGGAKELFSPEVMLKGKKLVF